MPKCPCHALQGRCSFWTVHVQGYYLLCMPSAAGPTMIYWQLPNHIAKRVPLATSGSAASLRRPWPALCRERSLPSAMGGRKRSIVDLQQQAEQASDSSEDAAAGLRGLSSAQLPRSSWNGTPCSSPMVIAAPAAKAAKTTHTYERTVCAGASPFLTSASFVPPHLLSTRADSLFPSASVQQVGSEAFFCLNTRCMRI